MTTYGTNCGNCLFFRGPVPVPRPLVNTQGGVVHKDPAEIDRSKAADLVTLPGHYPPIEVRGCTHARLHLVVSDRMCCALWDNPGALREWR